MPGHPRSSRPDAVMRTLVALPLLLALLLSLTAAPPARASLDDCLPYIDDRERALAMPRGLLLAVALTESEQNGRPHPFAMNIGGRALYASGPDEMRQVIRSNGGGFEPNIDVGCMQISLRHHAERFRDPDILLEPRYNVAYGAFYLQELYERYGTWTRAVAHYHSGNAERQTRYICRVFRNMVRIGAAEARDVPACERFW